MPDATNALAISDALSNKSQRDLVHKMLAELLITIEDQYYKDKTFYIDGYRFINCRFENCKLWVLRGTFEFHHCTIVGGTNIFGEDALKCIQFFASDNPNKAFQRKAYPDGSFSIAKGVSME